VVKLSFILSISILFAALTGCGSRGGQTGDASLVDSVGIAVRDPTLWPTMTFVPEGTEIDSVPLRAIDTTWTRATALSVSMLPAHDSASPFGTSGTVGFQFDRDFNGDGITDRARVGVYRDTTGTEGSFVLILTRSPKGAWVRAFVATEPGEPRLTVLVNDPTGLLWAECMTCGRWRPIFWSEGQYGLGPVVQQDAGQ